MQIKYTLFLIVILVTYKIHGQPDLIFESTYSASGEIEIDFPEQRILFDKDGNIIVLVRSYNYGDDVVLLKYDSNGKLLWDYYYGSSHKLGEKANAMVIDSENNIIITGESYTKYEWDFDVLSEFESELVVLKFSSDGELLWNYNKINTSDTKNSGNSITIDNNDNIYVTGVIDDRPPAIKKLITIGISKDGVEKWSDNIEGFAGKKIFHVNDQLMVVGIGEMDENVFLKYDLEGDQLIKNEFKNNHFFGSFELDQEGNIYSWHWGNYTLSKYDSDGQLLWDFDVPRDPPNTSDFIYDVAIDSDLSVYITGKHYKNATNADMLTYKLDKNGDELWSIIDKNEGLNTAEIGKHIQPLINSNTLISGEWQRAETSDEYRNIIRYVDIKGEEIWRISNEYEEYPNYKTYPAIHNNRLYTFSWHEENNVLNKLKVNVYGVITGIDDIKTKPNLIVYPNPGNREINISIPDDINGFCHIQFINNSGSIVFNTEHRGSNKLFRHDSSFLNPGVYLIKVTSKNEVYTSKLIIQ